MLRRYVAFLVYLCGICVALALWVGALYSDDLSEYKAPGCERWGEESVVLRGLPAASVLAFRFICLICVARLKRTNERRVFASKNIRFRKARVGFQTAWVLSQLAGAFNAGRGCGLV